MIAKKIPFKSSSRNSIGRVETCARYISNPTADFAKKAANYISQEEIGVGKEKCVYYGARNFFGKTQEAHIAEMVAVVSSAYRSRKPVNHYVFSWKNGEVPSRKNIEQLMDVFLKETKMQSHQVIYGHHADTDNHHVHVLLNRVHPVSKKTVEIDKGFDLNAIHRTCVIVERLQGWSIETNRKMAIHENGEIYDKKMSHLKQNNATSGLFFMKQRTGKKSSQETEKENIIDIIKTSGNWNEIHKKLQVIGCKIEKRDGGAVFYIDGVYIKASSVNRDISLSKIEKIIGTFRAESEIEAVEIKKEEPI
jgi:hypothetical protein